MSAADKNWSPPPWKAGLFTIPDLPADTGTLPRCGCSTAVRPHQHSVYCAFYRPYGQALGSVCFEPGDPGYEEACKLKDKAS